MKKYILFTVFLFVGSFLMAQSADDNAFAEAAKKDVTILNQKITKKYPELAINSEQAEKLEAIFFEQNKALSQVKIKGFDKNGYHEDRKNIVKQYLPQVEAILSAEQRLAYKKATAPYVPKKKSSAKS